MGRRKQTRQAKRLGRDYWAQIVAEFEAGGEDRHLFAKRHGFRLGTFQSWLYRLRKEGRPKTAARVGTTAGAVRMLPVVVTPAPDERIEVGVVGGAVVRFSAGVEPKYIAALVAELTAAC